MSRIHAQSSVQLQKKLGPFSGFTLCSTDLGWLHPTAVAVPGTGISKPDGVPWYNEAATNRHSGTLFMELQLLSMNTSILRLPLILRQALLHWPIRASHSAKPQLLSMTPSCLQTTWETLIRYQVRLLVTYKTLMGSGTQFLCTDSEKKLLIIFFV